MEKEQPPIDQVRLAFGQRLAAARELKKMTQTEVADRFGVKKATVSAWETGRGDPGVFRLRELAKLYEVSADALLWDSAPSLEAMQFAAEYDSLNDAKRKQLRALWIAYITSGATDDEIEKRMPVTRPTNREKQ